MKLSSKIYYGNIVKSKSLNNCHLSLTTYDIQSEVPFHCHKNPYLSVNLGAEYNEIGRHNEKSLCLGDVIVRPANYEHKNIFHNSRGICFNIEFVNNINSKITCLFNDIEIKPSTLDLYKLFVAFINNYFDDELSCLIAEALTSSRDETTKMKKQNWYNRVTERIQEE